jgi:hypothetical protein
MKKESFLLQAGVAGLGAVASAWILQKGYEKTGFYPPEPVFWFFIGVGSYASVEALEWTQGERHLALT